ncbi:MAG: S1 RNA-binding domain-containing protein, partial [Campylobacterota bacterium]|nr:S1 RNA-binding domain-containing protein [Campylobacterota bacterium]
ELEKIDVRTMAEALRVGEETLRDIIKELLKPGFDPREALPPIPFKEGVTDIKMLHEGSVVSGVVRNIADFGAFVDIGLKNDGMIHISKMSNKRITHPLEVLSINQFLPQIEVVSIDEEKGKVGLSLVQL